jgi:uncharacterized protein YycO
MKIQIAFFRGKSWISRFIRWFTRGDYSHVGILFNDGTIIEAWHHGGVLHSAKVGTRHEPGTVIDIYDFHATADQVRTMYQFLLNQLGLDYDFKGIAGFLLHSRSCPQDRQAWFCSELALAMAQSAGINLLNEKPFKVDPTRLSWSPLLKKVRTVMTAKDGTPIDIRSESEES